MNAKSCWAASASLSVACLFAATVLGEQPPAKPTEEALRKDYEKFMHSLDFKRVVKDYPKAIDNLNSTDLHKQITGLATLGATREPEAILWMVPFLDDADPGARLFAARYVQELITGICVQRRDPTRPDCLLPVGPNELDLRPLAWVAERMLKQPDDNGNTPVYAATLIRFLVLKSFESDLRAMLQSRHPAVQHNANWALEELGFRVANPVLNRPPFRGKPSGDGRR